MGLSCTYLCLEKHIQPFDRITSQAAYAHTTIENLVLDKSFFKISDLWVWLVLGRPFIYNPLVANPVCVEKVFILWIPR